MASKGGEKVLTIDCHIDRPWIVTKQRDTVITIDGMKAGGLDKAVCALYLSDAMQDKLGAYESTEELHRQYIELFHHPQFLFALEGGRLIDNRLNQLAAYKLCMDIKYMTLTHNFDTDWCSSATDDGQFPLTKFGVEVVKACERLGVVVDVSHCSDATIDSVLDVAVKPVIASHSGCREQLDHPRNLTDSHIQRIYNRRGIVCVPFAKRFVKDVDGVVKHIYHVIHMTGTYEAVGIGSDLDGAVCVIDDVTGWKMIQDRLARTFTDDAVRAICGGNVARVLGIEA